MPWGAADEAAPPRREQRNKSPAELDFYGEFYAALCGAPVLPVLPKAKCGRKLRPKGAKKARRRRAFFSYSFTLFLCFALSLGEKLARLADIFVDGVLERLDRLKLHLRAQELMQLDMDHPAVQVARKVEQMRLDGRCTAV